MYCHTCGSEVAAGAQFCTSCGSSQPALGATASEVAAIAPAFVAAGGGPAQTGRWISQGWEAVKSDLGMFVLMTIIMAAVNGAVPFLLQGALTGGFQAAFKRKFRGQKAELSDLFLGFQRFGSTIAAHLVILIFVFLGLLCLIIPGIVLMVMYTFTYLFVIEKRLGYWEAMRASHAVVKQDYLGYTLFLIALGLLNLLGALCLFVGLLVTIPISMGAIAAAYDQAVGFE